MEIDTEIMAHYAEGREGDRLTSRPSLELLRTQVLLERFLPAPPARGGPLQWAPGIRDRLADPDQRRLILDVLAAMESDPAVAGATAHLLAIGYRE